MSTKYIEDELPTGQAAPEVLEDRIWVDGCWDFFHHGGSPPAAIMLDARDKPSEFHQAMRALCCKQDS
jgi:ethanolamine-phosphate cytidylyltransferase